MAESDALGNSNRRNFLIMATSVVGGAGMAAACLPFVASMNPSSDVLARATTEFDLAGINPGEMRTVAWQGKPVFILRRTQEQIREMQAS
ncbi:MAG: ubiquinol-cytochrome c reductase iron-sulfur subunit, partial [Betaproteobacteria bacterium]|nr:ubiquinol-cytochrome c reductase iron-sulfur subunit [Betaproteobacteria bacterium]